MSTKLIRNLLGTCCASVLLAAPAVQAAVVDLTTSSSGELNGALFTTDYTQPTGTGVFDPFLTIQNNGTEQGYNSGSNPALFDTKRVPQWNHEIQLADLQTSTVNGNEYYSFVIDINEPNNADSLISLDMLKIWTSSTLQSSTSVDGSGTFNGSLGTLRYDLGSGNFVKYDDLNHGSGQSDIAFFVPVSNFSGSQ